MKRAKWDGMAPCGIHGADYKGQRCDLCKDRPLGPSDGEVREQERKAKSPTKTPSKRSKSTVGKVVSINTSYPTVEGVPEKDAEANTVSVRTKTSVGWPDNWHLLSPTWRATLLALLVKRVIGAVLSGGGPYQRQRTLEEFQRLTGWGKV